MVRYACTGDIPRLLELARQEHAVSPWAALPFDAEHAGNLMADFITTYGRTLLISDGGYLGGLVQHSGFSRALVAMEYVMFAVDGQGMALVRKFEEWAERMGAHSVVMHDYMGEGRLARVLTRRNNYRTLGQALVRTFGAKPQ